MVLLNNPKNSMTKLSEKVLSTIEHDHLTPQPRWKFQAKNYGMWAAFGLSVFFGSIAFAVMMERLVKGDWDIYMYLDRSFLGFMLTLLPYAWIVSLAAFGVLAYYNCRHTKCGYRYAPYLVVVVSVGTSLIIGEIFFVSGTGRKIDHMFAHSLPFYQKMKMQERRDIWMHPERGLLMGEVLEIGENGAVLIRDVKGNVWRINNGIEHVEIPHPSQQRSILKIIGENVQGEEFNARDIRLCDCDEEFDR